jgi:predicted HicB family RNase H-like nuclease
MEKEKLKVETHGRINLCLPKSLVEQLKKEAAIERRSLNNYVRLILEKRGEGGEVTGK